MAVQAADPGEAGARIAAVEVALDDFLDDRPIMTVLLLEAALVGRQEAVEVMEQQAAEHRALQMARAVDSRHIGKADSRSVPRLLIGSLVEAGREIGQRPAPWKVSPRENGYIESFNGKMRDELLNGELLDTLDEAKVLVEAWRKTSNLIRPHNSLGYSPPVPEAHVIGKFTLGRAQC
jgi:hypothetical protein